VTSIEIVFFLTITLVSILAHQRSIPCYCKPDHWIGPETRSYQLLLIIARNLKRFKNRFNISRATILTEFCNMKYMSYEILQQKFL